MENTIKESADVASECLRIKKEFWAEGNIALKQSGIILREPIETDRDEFLRLQFENAIDEAFFQKDSFQKIHPFSRSASKLNHQGSLPEQWRLFSGCDQRYRNYVV